MTVAESYAPLDWPPPNASRYRPLPLLKRCPHCGAPMGNLEGLSIRYDDEVHTGLCLRCAEHVQERRKGWRKGDAARIVRRGLLAAFPDLDLSRLPLYTQAVIWQSVERPPEREVRDGDVWFNPVTGLLADRVGWVWRTPKREDFTRAH